MSDSTYNGLIATLEILKFLCSDYSFEYLMTARLNQDALERFFGMMHNACGYGDYPDSTLFIQMYKLITTYSLVKSPKCSSVDGGEMISALLNINNIGVPDVEDRIQQFQHDIDNFIENRTISENVYMNIHNQRDYCGSSNSEVILAYIAGYIVQKSLRFNKCLASTSTLQSDQFHSRNAFINLLSRGHLIYPSVSIFSLLQILDKVILAELGSNKISSDIFLTITSKLGKMPVQLVGCDEHRTSLTESIVRFYLITRMHFICRRSKIMNKHDKED